MYRVHGKDGNTYDAPSLAILQQWVGEGRVLPITLVEDLLGGTQGPASEIEGLSFPASIRIDATPESNYPRGPGSEPAPSDLAVHLPLIRAVLSTLCFSPLGVVAVIYAAKIPEIVASGDMERARRYARTANIISNVSFIIGVICQLLIAKYKQFLLPM